MTEETPDSGVTTPAFSPSRRGYDRHEVDRFAAEMQGTVESLQRERDVLVAQLASLGVKRPADLQAEFDAVSREVGRILQAAREAADALRSRAADDATRWRREASSEAGETTSAAEHDAVAMRKDAWDTSTKMLDQVVAEAERRRRQAAEDVLLIRAEAEQEAHRLVSQGRKEIEDEARLTRLESERMLSRARTEAENVIENARQEAEAAQERARALEQRRAELMEELEETRTAIAGLETELTTRREALRLPEAEPQAVTGSTSVRVVPAGGEDENRWVADDETVRIVRSPAVVAEERVDAEAMAEEVLRLRSEVAQEPAPAVEAPAAQQPSAPKVLEPVPEPEPAPAPVAEEPVPVAEEPVPVAEEPVPEPAPEPEPVAAEPEPEPAPEPEPVAAEPVPVAAEPVPVAEEPVPVAEEPEPRLEQVPAVPQMVIADAAPSDTPIIDDLFSRLRSGGVPGVKAEGNGAATATAVTERPPATEPEPARPAAFEESESGPSPFELRDRLLLPVTNRALREVKRTVVDLQNRVLEDIRTGGAAGEPDGKSFEKALRPALIAFGDEAEIAGHAGAAELLGAAPNPDAAAAGNDPTPDFVSALVGAIEDAIDRSAQTGAGPRETGAAVSRVFRAWRTDEAERRMRHEAFGAYHQGLLAGLDAFGIGTVRAVASGRPCGDCPSIGTESWTPGGPPPAGTALPPARIDCACTIVPARRGT